MAGGGSAGWETWVGDFNGDGFADYADHSLYDGKFWIHLNNQAGGFSTTAWGGTNNGQTMPITNGAGDPNWDWAVGDVDGDGFADYVEHYRPTGEFWVHKNYRDGGFAPAGVNMAHGFVTPGLETFLGVGDAASTTGNPTPDGKADIWDVRMGDDGGVKIYPYLGTGAFGSNMLNGGCSGCTPYTTETEYLIGRFDNAKGFLVIHNAATGSMVLMKIVADLTHNPAVYTLVPDTSLSTSIGTTTAGTNWDNLGTPHAVITKEGSDMMYFGDTLISGPKHVYLIWYGNWANGWGNGSPPVYFEYPDAGYPSPTVNVVTNYFKQVGGSSYLNTISTYTDLRGDVLDSSLTYVSSVFDANSQGTLPTSGFGAAVNNIVSNAINNLGLPLDPYGVYAVVIAPSAGGPECEGTYGTHSSLLVNNVLVHWAVTSDPVGNPNCYYTTRGYNPAPYDGLLYEYPAGSGTEVSPSGNYSADAIIDLMSHEIAEQLTDPADDGVHKGGWHQTTNLAASDENADRCEFAPYFPASGATYPTYSDLTLTPDGGNYYVQPLWVLTSTPGCAMSYP